MPVAPLSYTASPALAEIVGPGPFSLAQVSGKFWAYVAARGHDDRVAELIGSHDPITGPGQLAACLSLHLRPC